MGICYQITCLKCGNQNTYNEYVGFIPINDGVIDEIQKSPEFSEIRQYANTYYDIYDAMYKIYYCKECKTLQENLYFKLGKLTSYTPKRKCPKCNRFMQRLKSGEILMEGKIEVKCESCGAEDIAGENGHVERIFWD